MADHRFSWLDVTGLLVGVGGLLIFRSTALQQSAPTRPFERKQAPVVVDTTGLATKGAPTAKFGLIEVSDFQCPYCGRFARETAPKLQERFVATGRLRWSFMHRPLESHGMARGAAEAAECAGEQHEFWRMHDSLFLHQDELDAVGLARRATSLSLNLELFTSCVARTPPHAVIAQDTDLADTLGITGTPTLLLGSIPSNGKLLVTKRLAGAAPLEVVTKLIEQLIAS